MQKLKAQTDGVRWPNFPGRQTGAILGILYQLEQTQWYPPERLLEGQFDQLAALLAHARTTVPFYRDRLGEAPDGASLQRDWSDLPILTRQEIQAAGNGLTTQALPPSHGDITDIHTSGSTGQPIRVLRSRLWSFFRGATTLRDHLWHRRDLTGKLASIRDSTKGQHLYPVGSHSRAWGPVTGEVFENGPSVGLNVNTSPEQQTDWLLREAPDYFLSFPTVIERLARHCLDQGIALPSLKQILTISEVVTPDLREICRQAWNLPVADLYSSREVGYLALQCPDHEHYHIQSETLLLEVVDEAGRACGPGEVGRVLVTPLHNFAMPLIRYEIGDYAEVAGPCPCGRGLPVIRRILGRTQDMVVLPDGQRRWPLLSASHVEALLALGPIRQYQIVQKDLEGLEFRLVCERPLDDGEITRLEAWTREKFNYGFSITVSYHDKIPRTAAGKYFDFVSEIPPT